MPSRLLLALRGRSVAAGVGALCIAGLLVASAVMIQTQRHAHSEAQDRAEFAAAARQVVITLMSIDFNDPQASMDRIIGNSTGEFLNDFTHSANDFRRMSEDSQVVTKAEVKAAAVQSMTSDTAEVLVAVFSTITDPAGAQEAPRSWRLKVGLQRDDHQIKMSKVEFV